MKQISLISLVYNEAENLPRYFSAVTKLHYPRECFEIVFVNDGSTDNSLRLLQEWQKQTDIPVKIVNLTANTGVAAARIRGVEHATNTWVLFCDIKCEIFADALQQLDQIDYPLINCNVLQKRDHMFDAFFAIIRKTLFPTSTGGGYADLFITKENFDTITKGGGVLFSEKQFFLESQFENTNDKNCSDDIRLIANMVQKMPMLKTAKVNFYYNTRKSFWGNCHHIYHRGPKFIDYYFTPGSRYFWHIIAGLLALLLLPPMLYFFSVPTISAGFIINGAIAAYFGKNLGEMITVFLLFPLVFAIFFAGILKGILIKIFART